MPVPMYVGSVNTRVSVNTVGSVVHVFPPVDWIVSVRPFVVIGVTDVEFAPGLFDAQVELQTSIKPGPFVESVPSKLHQKPNTLIGWFDAAFTPSFVPTVDVQAITEPGMENSKPAISHRLSSTCRNRLR